MNFSKLRLALFFSILLVTASCGKKDKGSETPQGNSTDRAAMLTNIADNLVLPAYASFETKLNAMISKSDAFRNDPTTATLADYRTAWADAYVEWQKAALYEFGPAADNALNSYMNIYPTNVTNIQANIQAGNANLDVSGAYPTQGFPALDYLLNGSAATDNEIIALYTTDADAAKRKAYLLQLTNQMHSKFDLVYQTWKTSYRDSFVSNTGTGLFSSTSLMVNGIVFYYERYIRSGKFGVPSGAMVNGVVSAQSVEGYYNKTISLSLAKAAHKAFVDFFNGKSVLTNTEGASLKTYLDGLGAKDATTQVLLSENINTQFAVISGKLNLLTDDLSNEVATNNTAMIAVYNEMQKLIGLIKVDMTSAMSITITYTDNDGD
ncbi:MAG: imelysin family protein [Cytophaga sp.]|uniref:imelysin family protein n=1 Tax=Cytophaga sp. TaxID=29535 RepID=UPI003F7F6328